MVIVLGCKTLLYRLIEYVLCYNRMSRISTLSRRLREREAPHVIT